MRTAILALAAALAPVLPAAATELNFDTYVAASYGDRISVFGLGYGAAGGATPNVVLDFVTNSGRPLIVYASGYATLLNALGHGNFNEPGYIQFTPDAGFDVVLSGFQLAGWSAGSYANSRIQVVDTAGTSYLDTGSFTFQPNSVLGFPGAPIRSSLPLRLVVADFGDLAIDNIVFSQVASVPEPGSWALMLVGLGLLARRRLRTVA